MIAITLEMRPLSGRTLYAICGSGLSTDLPATIQVIETANCLETDSNGEVLNADSTGDELGDGNLASDNMDKIHLTITELKDVYRPGEKILFSVSAEGASDNACNIGSPRVSIRADDNKTELDLSISFGLNTALFCGGLEPLIKEWTFGGEPESGIVFD